MLGPMLAELDDVLAETQRVSPRVDAYLADNGHQNGKNKASAKNSSRSDDVEGQYTVA